MNQFTVNYVALVFLLSLSQAFCWTTANTYGTKCRYDSDCFINEVHNGLVCNFGEPRTCRCQQHLQWDFHGQRCYNIEDTTFGSNFDPVKDLIIPGIIVATIGAMVYLGIKLFCNCGKLWRRRRRRMDLPRDLDEPPQPPATWVASYRVFSSLNGMDPRSPSGLSPPGPPGFPMHPTPCMGLFLPSSHLAATASPPPYEEALKHKVILSSYPGVVTGHAGPPPTQDPNGQNP